MFKNKYLYTNYAWALLLASAAHAQNPSTRSGQGFPTRPIRFIVPFQPGAGSDITARTVAGKMSELLGQQVVVDNRPGAAGNIGLELAAHSAADGYTLTLVSATQSVNSVLQKKMPYDLVRDFAPVSQMTSQPYCLTVHPGIPSKTAREFIELVRAKPNFYTYDINGWYGMLAPAAIPKPVLATLNHAVLEALKAPDVGPRFALDGSEPVGSTAEAFAAHIKREIAKYAKVTKDAGMKID